jgi:hypothetical protein
MAGREGYLYERCHPEDAYDDTHCMPPGTERVYRYYSQTRREYAIFPESQLGVYEDLGYIPVPGLNRWIGYAYANVDSDGDAVIDGLEMLLGLDPNRTDSDCDGRTDGQEVLDYDFTVHGHTDPLDGPCGTIFADGFEAGNAGRWSEITGD